MSTFNNTYNSTLSASAQGQLSSNYTNWLSAEIKLAADYIGYLVFQQAKTAGATNVDAVAAGKAAFDAVSAGSFSLTDLFGAAQSKTGPVAGTAISDPTPKLSVNGYELSLSGLLDGSKTATETWTTSTKVGKTTDTVFHTREFLTTTKAAEYDLNWAKINSAPTADKITASLFETESDYDAQHNITNTAADIKIVNLLDPTKVTDVDGDTLTTSNYTLKVDGTSVSGLDYVSFENGALKIDTNSSTLNSLKLGEKLVMTVAYDINDGNGHTISNTAEVEIIGTSDQYQATGHGSVQNTYLSSGGNVNNAQLVAVFDTQNEQAGVIDRQITSSKIIATEIGLTGNQKIGVSDSGTADWSSGTINLTSAATSATVNLVSTALDDGKVDYNVNFNKTDATDSVTVKLDYDYTYWYLA